jgi:hypothetical protein
MILTPFAVALAIAGLIASESLASTIRTLAPLLIRVSMSVSCCSALSLASARSYLPPLASMALTIAGSSAFFQRSCE